MKKLLVFLGIILLMVVFVFPMQIQAQEKAKKDRWEVEVDYGQFKLMKYKRTADVTEEKNFNPDLNLAFRLRIWRGWYLGFLAGTRREIQIETYRTDIYTNYFWLEDRFGNFLAKDYIYVTKLKYNNFYIGADTKINLFTIKISKSVGISPYGRVGIKKWFAMADGFEGTIDYALFDLDKSTSIPYLFYHTEFYPTGNWQCKVKEMFWAVNPDGSKGKVIYEKEGTSAIARYKPQLILFYGGGFSLNWQKVFLSVDLQVEKRKDKWLWPPQDGGGSGISGTFWYLSWKVGLGYRF